MKQKKDNSTIKITCHNCNHQWYTKSNLIKVTCPSCNTKTPKKPLILVKGGKENE